MSNNFWHEGVIEVIIFKHLIPPPLKIDNRCTLHVGKCPNMDAPYKRTRRPDD